MKIIARVRSDFPSKFGIPRQSSLVEGLRSRIVFEPEFRDPSALRGLEDFSYIWILWEFSMAHREKWSPTVRPPRLGGNERMGVFATRSPFRPNSIGLSSVRLERIEWKTPEGPVLHVLGADLVDGTPVYDIKPYLPYTDSHPEASGGFAEEHQSDTLQIQCSEEWLQKIPPDQRDNVLEILRQDPRPSYQEDPERIYGMEYAGMEIRFRVAGDILTVYQIWIKGEQGYGAKEV